MKLETRTNLNYILFSAIIYVVVAVSFYLAVEYVVYDTVDKRLLVEKRDFQHFIDKNGYWETSCYFVEDKINVQAVSVPAVQVFKDTLLLSRYDDKLIPFRELSFDMPLAGEIYRVSIRKSLIESEELLKIITVVMLIVLSGGLSLLYLFQQRTSKGLWRPFYEALSFTKAFDVNKDQKLTSSHQKVYEFNELNSSLNKMTDRILKDYLNLKEFTENASHEIQTPLALINSRVETLIQDKDMSAKHGSWIQDIHESTMRLSKLTQALLLLSKIDNGQFNDAELVDLRPILEQRLVDMEDVFLLKSIQLSTKITASFFMNVSPSLADVLITNLLNNAVKHNLPNGGVVEISLSSKGILVSNTGGVLTMDPDKLFERFQKQSKSSSSLGLGLAIVKKICDLSGVNVAYRYKDGFHKIEIGSLS